MWANNGNLDSSKIYAYLRHVGTEAMLVVVNFDQQNAKEFLLHIPAHAFNTVGIPVGGRLSLTPVLGDASEEVIDVQQVIGLGINVRLQPMSGVIYAIKA